MIFPFHDLSAEQSIMLVVWSQQLDWPRAHPSHLVPAWTDVPRHGQGRPNPTDPRCALRSNQLELWPQLSSAFTTHRRMLAWDILGQLAWDVKGFKSSSSTWHAPCCQNNSDGDDLCNYVILHDATFEHWHCIEEADFHRPPVDVWGQRWAEDSRCFRQKHPPRASTPLP
jgi:hypothetical protein